MKSRKLHGLILITAVILLAACSKKGPSYTQYIPKDASYVISLDVKSMVTKLEKDSLSVENMLEVIRDSSNPSKYSKAIEMWKQFKDAGLDLENKVFIAVPAVNMTTGNVGIEVLAGLKDEKKLEAFVAKMPDAPKVTKEGDITYATVGEWTIGWNKEAVMILTDFDTQNMPAMYNDDSTASAPAPAPVPGATAGVPAKMKKYFALKKDESIASVEVFNTLSGEKGDVTFFSNSTSLAGASGNPALAMMPKLKELLENIYSTTILNFEDGKVVMKGNTYVGPKLAEILKKYTGPQIDMSLIEPYASNNVDGVTAFSFNPELIPALLKETGFDAMADVVLTQQGITTTEIVKAFKGDFAVIFSDFAISKVEKRNWEDEPYMSNEPSAKLLVAVRIGDKAAFDKLVALATKTGTLIRQGNRLVPARNGEADTTEKIFLGIENDLLVFSTDDAVYKSYVAKTGKIGLSNDAMSTIKGSSIAFFLDVEKILAGIPETIFDSTDAHEKNVLAKSKTVFKTMSFKTDNFDGKKISGSGEVVMATQKNSLPQLVRFLMYTAQEMKLKQAEDAAKWHTEYDTVPDSTSTEPAP
jgi:predicted small lipoprotein YifL